MKVTARTLSLLRYRREQREMNKQGFFRISLHHSEEQKMDWDARFLDAKVSQCGHYIYVKRETEEEIKERQAHDLGHSYGQLDRVANKPYNPKHPNINPFGHQGIVKAFRDAYHAAFYSKSP